MSVRLMSLAWKYPGSASEKVVLLKLCDCAGDDGGEVYPSVATICDDTGLTRRSVQTILAKFRDQGLLLVERTATAQSSTVYRIDVEALERGATGAPAQDVRPRNPRTRGATGAREGRNECAGGAQLVRPNHHRTIIEPSVDTYAADAAESVSAAKDRWNAMVAGTPIRPVQVMSDKRRKHLGVRLRECGGLDGWEVALSKIRGSPYLRGEVNGWVVTFDWAIKKENFIKIMEGNYDRRTGENGKQPRTQQSDRRAILEGLGLAPDSGEFFRDFASDCGFAAGGD